jgi:hypothetical protein
MRFYYVDTNGYVHSSRRSELDLWGDDNVRKVFHCRSDAERWTARAVPCVQCGYLTTLSICETCQEDIECSTQEALASLQR